MSRALQALLIGLPLLVSGGVLLARRRRGARLSAMYLLGMVGLAGMAGFWWFYSGTPEGGPEVAWVVGLVAALLAVVAAASPRWGARTVLASAVVAPLAFLAYTGSLYAFGEGVTDEAGGQVPFTDMAPVSLIVSAFYVVPALTIWVLLRPSRPAKAAPPGWYPDPGDPARRRFWDGRAWTDRTAPVEGDPHPVT